MSDDVWDRVTFEIKRIGFGRWRARATIRMSVGGDVVVSANRLTRRRAERWIERRQRAIEDEFGHGWEIHPREDQT